MPERVGAGLIDNEAAAAPCDFSERAVTSANARFAMDKTFGDRKAKTFHQGWIDGETTCAICAIKDVIVHLLQPANRPGGSTELAQFSLNFAAESAGTATNQFKIELKPRFPQSIGCTQ